MAVSSAPAASASVVLAGWATTSTSGPAVMDCGEGPTQVQPASMILACADDGEIAKNLQWSSWTATTATATGIVTWRACAVECADGKQWKSAAAQVTLTDPVPESGDGVLFTRLALNVTGSTPEGFLRQVTFSEAPVPVTSLPASPPTAPEQGPTPAISAAPSGSLGFARIEGYWALAGGPTGNESVSGVGTFSAAQIAAAITGAESSFLPGIIQPGVDYCGSGADRAGWGLFQITCGNSSPPAFGSDFQLLDPWNNAEAAVSKYKADASAGLNGFDPWSTFLSGAFVPFLQHISINKNISDPGEYAQINPTPPGTPSSPKAAPGSRFGPPVPGSTPPAAAYSTSVSKLLQEQTVIFNASASKAGSGSITKYAWNFGDGTTASGETVSHVFVTSAPVTVTLAVTNSNGKNASLSRSWFVLPSDRSASNYIDSGENQQHLFYETSAGALQQDWWDTQKWSTQPLTGSPHTDPVTLNYGSQEHVFDISTSGAIEQDFWNGSAWVHQTLPGTAATGSALGGADFITGGGTLEQHVFFAGSDGDLEQTWWNGQQWLSQNLPGKPAAGSPIVSSDYVTGGGVLQQHVFFTGAGDTLQQTWWNGSTWLNQTLPGTPATGQNTMATEDYMDGSTLQQHVFFIGPGGTLQQTWWNGATWLSQTLPGSPVASGGLVTSDLGPGEHVFFTGSGSTLQQTWWTGTTWETQTLPGTAARVLGTNDYPGAAMQQHVFFDNPSKALQQTWWTGNAWSTQPLPGTAVGS